MAKVRVYELAKQRGLESKDVLKELQDMGEYVRSASSFIEAPVVERLLQRLDHPTPEPNPALLRRSPEPKAGRVFAAWKGAGVVRRGPKPPITRPGERPPKPSDVVAQFKPAPPGELTDEQVLRNLLGPGQSPVRKRSRRDPNRRRDGGRNSNKQPRPTVAPELLDEWQLLVYRYKAYEDLDRIGAEAEFWESTGLPVGKVKSWLDRGGSSAVPAIIIGLHEAGFTPQQPFQNLSPHGNDRTTTAYGMVKGGRSPKEVKEIFDLARERRKYW